MTWVFDEIIDTVLQDMCSGIDTSGGSTPTCFHPIKRFHIPTGIVTYGMFISGVNFALECVRDGVPVPEHFAQYTKMAPVDHGACGAAAERLAELTQQLRGSIPGYEEQQKKLQQYQEEKAGVGGLRALLKAARASNAQLKARIVAMETKAKADAEPLNTADPATVGELQRASRFKSQVIASQRAEIEALKERNKCLLETVNAMQAAAETNAAENLLDLDTF
jgi:hypothetical protein